MNAIWSATALCLIYVIAVSFIPVSGGSAFSLYFVVVNSTLVFLFLSFTLPLLAGVIAYGGPKWPHPGPWAMSAGLYRLVTFLAMLGMLVIFYIAVQPPNETVLWIVVAFVLLALVIWVLFEQRRFQGPPIGEAAIEKRRAAIAAAEKAVGEVCLTGTGGAL